MKNASDILKRIKEEGKRADASEVAIRVGVSASLVRKVAAGTRHNDIVLLAYQKLLNERLKAQVQFKADKKGQPCA